MTGSGWLDTGMEVVALPAETHQLGREVDPAVVAEYLHVLLDDGSHRDEGDAALAAFGLGDEDLEWLWDAVRDEFVERTVAPELEPGLITPAMTVEEAATRISAVLRGSSRDVRS